MLGLTITVRANSQTIKLHRGIIVWNNHDTSLRILLNVPEKDRYPVGAKLLYIYVAITWVDGILIVSEELESRLSLDGLQDTGYSLHEWEIDALMNYRDGCRPDDLVPRYPDDNLMQLVWEISNSRV